MNRAHPAVHVLLIVAALLVALVTPTNHAIARPTEQQIAPVKEKLDKKIKIQFLETPLHRVVETLQREAGVTFVVDTEQSGGIEENPVTLEADSMSILDALDWACRVTGADWEVTGGVIVVSSRRAIARRNLVTKVYDIRSLLVFVPNFMGRSLSIDDALSNTNSGGSAGSFGSNAQSSTSLFGDDSGELDESLTRAEKVEQIVTLIQDTIGVQSDWAAYGGELYSVRELAGSLIIRVTPHEHEQIAKLLTDLTQANERMVALEARFLIVPSATLDNLLGKDGATMVLDAKQVDALVADVQKADARSRKLGAARSVCYNGQRIAVTAANELTFLSDVEPIPGTAGVDPTLSTVRQGASLDVQPTISYQGDAVSLTLRSEVVTEVSLTTSPVPTGSHDTGLTVTGQATDGGEKKPANVKGTVVPSRPARQGLVEVEKPKQDVVRYRTSAQVPDGGAVVLSAGSNMLKALNDGESEVVLILRVRIHTGK